MVRLCSLLVCCTIASTVSYALAQEPAQTRETGAKFVGATGCKSSSCHGGAGQKRSQYITWLRQDFHTRGYAILLNARSARIAETVGIAQPQSAARCTVCHSPLQSVAQTRLGPTARPDEGVSCESCHGAAGSWLRGHTRSDWTYAMRVSAGMHDLRSLYVRATACVACHQNVDTDLLKAGHPPLVFELDSQTVNQPPHWREDHPWHGMRAWLVGQAVALRETAWRAQTDPNPAADSQETATAVAWLLQKVTLIEPRLPKIVEPPTSDLQPLQKQADALARQAATWNPDIDSAMAMLRALAETDSDFAAPKERSMQQLYYRARRLVLALDRVSRGLNANRSVPLQIEPELNSLREDVRSYGVLDLTRFAADLRALRKKL